MRSKTRAEGGVCRLLGEVFQVKEYCTEKKQFEQKRLKKDKAESQWVSGGRSFQRGEITGIKAPGVGRSLVFFKNNSSQEVKLT